MTRWAEHIRLCVDEECSRYPDAPRDMLAQVAAAMVRVESSCDEQACRYEHNYRYVSDPSHRPGKCTEATEIFLQSCSWGLMQIMGSTAREYGLRGWITDLCNPLVGIRFGVRYLVSRARLYGWDRDSAIAAYNAGSARRLLRRAGEPFVNQEYVDKVLAAMDHPEAPE